MLLLFINFLHAKAQTVQEKKQHFRNLLAPAVDDVYNKLQIQYDEISKHINNKEYKEKILNLKKTYKAKTDKELLMALKPHPKSITMAQAAMESAWGTSRFFREANNIFGVWSFNKNEPRIAAKQKRGTKTVWLKKYASVKESIAHYYKTLSRSKSFKEFRELKMKTNNPYELVKKLENYSELRGKYTKELSQIIRYNKFYLYDK